MSTDVNPRGLSGEGRGVAPEGLDEAVAGGELFIRDLDATGTRPPALFAAAGPDDAAEYDDDDDDEGGIVTTQMLGEEGRGEEEAEPRGRGEKGGRSGDSAKVSPPNPVQHSE